MDDKIFAPPRFLHGFGGGGNVVWCYYGNGSARRCAIIGARQRSGTSRASGPGTNRLGRPRNQSTIWETNTALKEWQVLIIDRLFDKCVLWGTGLQHHLTHSPVCSGTSRTSSGSLPTEDPPLPMAL
ncbi:hypothetical protein Baya_14936 [Bagarius yarrelli]|uniref:Uncharacterized protein n=1 Tax=Bagarius yarrelli TaxID=175774 RepID=A0A556VA96_BAGYA|nr:hypothetical protein Baya_14936 [Bagarius yarrelli]